MRRPCPPSPRLFFLDIHMPGVNGLEAARVVTAEAETLIRKPIKELLDELDPEKFWQVHRATIVNVDCIAAVRRGLKDQAEISLKGHRETLIVARNFTHLFKQM